MGDRPINRIGRALYGEVWKGPLSRDLGIRKDTVDDWDRGRSEPHPEIYRRLLAMAETRRISLDAVIKEMHSLTGHA